MRMPLNLQSIIMTLQSFWAEWGCLIWQPYYTQVGAGTMNPATFLRVLGPEPWNVAYVEPSIRPDDGRYGENPNRMQMHYQFQVILKPDPGNPQEIYLNSLEAIGIDPRQHDIRFVEDNWEQPAIGAWGLGWEVWLDGQEITQFTYFQQAGGMTLDPVSVELTYGLERIAIALQRVDGFQNIRWGANLTDGDVNLQAEREHCKYYFEIADIERLRMLYNLFEAEADACLKQGLVLPAYDYVLKCSHTFNVLDARGAVGVTERQALFGRMRDLATRVAKAYVEQREALGFPWLREELQGSGLGSAPRLSSSQQSLEPMGKPAAFLLEIGTEELPVADLDSALNQLREKVVGWLDALRLEHGEIVILGTPRRLVVYVKDVLPLQTEVEQIIKGPPAERAFGPDGKPTQAAEGFARSRGVDVTSLQTRQVDSGQYAVAIVRHKGRPAPEVLGKALPDLLASLRFEKSMRWNSSNVFFSRPIRWLLALYGDENECQVVPFEYAGVRSGNTTRGLRFQEPEEFCVQSPDRYFIKMAEQGIILETTQRQAVIQRQIQNLSAQVEGEIQDDPALLAEVANLVEAPTVLRGRFDPSFLRLPQEVLISVMKKHQRYFPVVSMGRSAHLGAGDGRDLLPFFIAIVNGRGNSLDIITEGNEHVIKARFADADFFVREDEKVPLEAHLPRLGTLLFQVDLGSMLDKTNRIVALVDKLSPKLGLSEADTRVAHRAAQLCKADLATRMVVEMTSLQGVMGRYYAINSGEPLAVAQAIVEHYQPRFSGDQPPQSLPGLVVGLADRLDSLAGLFAVNLAPSGNKDPFAQRRLALGLVQNLIAWDLDFDLRENLLVAGELLPVPFDNSKALQIVNFIAERMRSIFLDQGQRYDVVDAVLAVQGNNPSKAAKAVAALAKWIVRSDWSSILAAYSRCVRITRDQNTRFVVDPKVFVEEDEHLLYENLVSAESTTRLPGSVDDFLSAFLPVIPAINRFFDTVLVMDEDAGLRQNRLGLLQRIVALAEGVADMSRLEGF